jgi:hypothetical protein
MTDCAAKNVVVKLKGFYDVEHLRSYSAVLFVEDILCGFEVGRLKILSSR